MNTTPQPAGTQAALDAVHAAVRRHSPELADLLESLPSPPELPLLSDAEDAIDDVQTTLTEITAGGKLAWSDENEVPGSTAVVFEVEALPGATIHVGYSYASGQYGLYAACFGNDGERRWVHTEQGSFPYPLILSRPVAVHDGRVAIAVLDLAGGPVTMDVLCLDAATGQVAWRQRPNPEEYGFLIAMAADEEQGLFVGTGVAFRNGRVGPPVLALNAADGAVVRNDFVAPSTGGADAAAVAYAVAVDGDVFLGGLAQISGPYGAWAARAKAGGETPWQTMLGEDRGAIFAVFPRQSGLVVGGWSGNQEALCALLDSSTGDPVWVHHETLDGPSLPYDWAVDAAGTQLFACGIHYAPDLRAFVSARSMATGEPTWLHRDSALLDETYAGWLGVELSADGADVFVTGCEGGQDDHTWWCRVVTARLNASDGSPAWISRYGDKQGSRASYALALADERLAVGGGVARDADEQDYRALALAHHVKGLVEQTTDAAKDTLPVR